MKIFADQMNNKIRLEKPPKRIISLVPSQTELLYDLGLEEEVIGITKFCIHPDEWFRSKARVGGTKKIDFEQIKKLKPDLIIGNKEENEEVQIKELMKHYPVWMSDIKTLRDACAMIQSVGEIAGKKEEAAGLVDSISKKCEELQSHISSLRSPIQHCLYFIWKSPYMVVGKDTFIDHMLELCGLASPPSAAIGLPKALPAPLQVERGVENRYTVVTIEQIKQINPDLIFLSSEPYPFKEKHIAEFQAICPNAKIKLVDGEMFSWYGSRLLKAPGYFKKLIKNLATNSH